MRIQDLPGTYTIRPLVFGLTPSRDLHITVRIKSDGSLLYLEGRVIKEARQKMANALPGTWSATDDGILTSEIAGYSQWIDFSKVRHIHKVRKGVVLPMRSTLLDDALFKLGRIVFRRAHIVRHADADEHV